jgi:hypothetical protein
LPWLAAVTGSAGSQPRKVVEAVIALAPSPNGFTATDVAARVGGLGNDCRSQYGPRHAAYDLKKLRGKHIVCRIGQTRRYPKRRRISLTMWLDQAPEARPTIAPDD